MKNAVRFCESFAGSIGLICKNTGIMSENGASVLTILYKSLWRIQNLLKKYLTNFKIML